MSVRKSGRHTVALCGTAGAGRRAGATASGGTDGTGGGGSVGDPYSHVVTYTVPRSHSVTQCRSDCQNFADSLPVPVSQCSTSLPLGVHHRAHCVAEALSRPSPPS